MTRLSATWVQLLTQRTLPAEKQRPGLQRLSPLFWLQYTGLGRVGRQVRGGLSREPFSHPPAPSASSPTPVHTIVCGLEDCF